MRHVSVVLDYEIMVRLKVVSVTWKLTPCLMIASQIWLSARGGASPAGSYSKTVTINDQSWEMYIGTVSTWSVVRLPILCDRCLPLKSFGPDLVRGRRRDNVV